MGKHSVLWNAHLHLGLQQRLFFVLTFLIKQMFGLQNDESENC